MLMLMFLAGCKGYLAAPADQRIPSIQNTRESAFTPASVTCGPPRHYQYTLDRNVMLDNQIAIMQVNVPDSGRAVARFSARFTNLDSTNIYSWNSRVSVAGNFFAMGDMATDICPGTTDINTNIGYGQLQAGNSTVAVHAGDIYVPVYGNGTRVQGANPPTPLCFV